MWLLKFFYLMLGYVGGYILFTHSAIASTNTVSTEFVLLYRNEFTGLLCVITMFLGTWLGVKMPTKAGELELSNSIKVVAGLLGGVLAFIYCLQKDKGLSLMNPIWIGVASVALPLALMTLRDRIIAYAKIAKIPKGGE